MKKVFIARHTTKDREALNEYDYDIELTADGITKAEKMAKHLASKNPNIGLIVASPAVRTRHTAEIFAKELAYNKTIMLNEVLYMAFVNELIETITYTYDSIDTMLIVGHNPSLTALAVTLVGFKEKFEEGAVMEIDFDCNSWIDIDKSNAKLVSYTKSSDV
ncbi:phosphohistidine phosphatase [Aliarcobacter faecis]|uniref:SixA phosphatase family protein n=1 Tax=Aliarcobacter faecis TaxID=1564138 RepID=UPI00047B44AA|nr:histidine phosphatase family protein [Aliarcobacter faecis]QKF73859.1 phosphohistidine phosphatase [Aliarcobacter faecis]